MAVAGYFFSPALHFHTHSQTHKPLSTPFIYLRQQPVLGIVDVRDAINTFIKHWLPIGKTSRRMNENNVIINTEEKFKPASSGMAEGIHKAEPQQGTGCFLSFHKPAAQELNNNNATCISNLHAQRRRHRRRSL